VKQVSKSELFEIDDSELMTITQKICDLGEELEIDADRFAIILTMVATSLCDLQGIEVQAVREMDS
jgi:hypothetical protein